MRGIFADPPSARIVHYCFVRCFGAVCAGWRFPMRRRPGAVYWLNNKVDPGSKIAWDINYFTFDFNSLDKANVFPNAGGDDKSDACFIRCVED